jgi:hypothetical protein
LYDVERFFQGIGIEPVADMKIDLQHFLISIFLVPDSHCHPFFLARILFFTFLLNVVAISNIYRLLLLLLLLARMTQSVQGLGYGMDDRASIPDRADIFFLVAIAFRPALAPPPPQPLI